MAKKPKFTNGDDKVNLGGGDDVANAKGGDDIVSGGSGNDTINGGAGNDFLRGGTGDDTLNGGEGNDRLAGGEGDDTLNGGAGVNTADGGAGDDLLVLDGNFADAKITATADGFKIVTAGGETTVKNVESFSFADGVKGADELLPGSGKTFVLTVPIDNIIGTTGDDTIVGDNNTLTADIIAGGDGKDKLVVAAGNGALVGTPTMSGVETVEGTNTNNFTLNLANVKDVTAFNIANGNGDIALNGAVSIAEVSLSSVGVGGTSSTDTDVTLSYAAAAVAGTTDALKLNLNNTVLFDVGGGTADLTFAGVETLNLASAGTANQIENIAGGTGLKTVVATGAANLTAAFASTGTGLTSYDGSAATGKQSITFGAASDVTVKGGSADDSFSFGATLSSKDSVDAGAGTDTVAVDGADFQIGDGLAALNALKNVERLQFTGATGANINDTTLTAVLSAIVFDTTGNDTVVDAVATSNYAFGTANAGDASFTMKAGETTLNLALTGDVTAASAGDRDADVAALNTGAASVVNVNSTGLTTGQTNEIAAVTNAANALFVVKGDANTSIASFANAVNFDASALTGALTVTGSGSADTIRGGAGGSTINGGVAADTIFLTSSSTKVDTIVQQQTFATHETGESTIADTINGFVTGIGGDRVQLANGQTSAANATPVHQEAGTTAPVIAVATDVFEFTLNIPASLAGDTGANLITGMGTPTVAGAAAWNGYIVAYSGGDAYLYIASTADGTFDNENELAQVAVFKNVAVGSFDASEFIF